MKGKTVTIGGVQSDHNKVNLLEDVARNAPTMLWVTDTAGAILFQNDQYLHFTGLSAEVARRSDSWAQQVHPDDLNTVMDAYVEALRSQQSFAVEYRLRRHDGQFREVLDSARPRFDLNGKFAGYIGSTMDITKRKQQERVILETTASSERRSRELKLLYELKSDLQVCREVEETRYVLVKYCEKLFPGADARLLLYNNSRDLVEPFLSCGKTNSTLRDVVPPSDCWALRKGKSHLERATTMGAICPNARGCGRDNYLCLPMIAFGDTVGIFRLKVPVAGSDSSVSESVEALVELGNMMADEVATAIEELKLRAKLQHQSSRDPLTNLYNRRYFMEAIERELYRSNSENLNLGLLMIDLDFFKKFNDTHGHIGGDLVLRAFGKLLEDSTLGTDIVCRFGGEEFAIILVDCPLAGARSRAQKIVNDTRLMTVDLHGEVLTGITTSVGIASYPADGRTIDELLSNADSALYQAKSAGRDRVCEFDQGNGTVSKIAVGQ